MNPRRYGFPRTEEERRTVHYQRYGTNTLPPRGTGLTGKVKLDSVLNKQSGLSQDLTPAQIYYKNRVFLPSALSFIGVIAGVLQGKTLARKVLFALLWGTVGGVVGGAVEWRRVRDILSEAQGEIRY